MLTDSPNEYVHYVFSFAQKWIFRWSRVLLSWPRIILRISISSWRFNCWTYLMRWTKDVLGCSMCLKVPLIVFRTFVHIFHSFDIIASFHDFACFNVQDLSLDTQVSHRRLTEITSCSSCAWYLQHYWLLNFTAWNDVMCYRWVGGMRTLRIRDVHFKLLEMRYFV